MKYLVLLVSLFIVVGCSGSETIIKDIKIEMTVSAVKLDSVRVTNTVIPDSVKKVFDKAVSSLPDSAYVEAVKDVQLDKNQPAKKVKIKYYPKKQIFSLDIPERKVDTTLTDTTKFIIKKDTTTAEKMGYGLIGIVVFIVIAVGAYFYFKSKS